MFEGDQHVYVGDYDDSCENLQIKTIQCKYSAPLVRAIITALKEHTHLQHHLTLRPAGGSTVD